jgi:hypothetical protein
MLPGFKTNANRKIPGKFLAKIFLQASEAVEEQKVSLQL